ncbi:MAG: caspase family protein, partial [Bacteroidota bacterium]
LATLGLLYCTVFCQGQSYQVMVKKEAVQKINRLTFSANGQYMATHETGEKSVIKIWDQHFQLVKNIPLLGRTARRIAMSPTGRFVAYVVGKNEIGIWDAKLGTTSFWGKSNFDVRALKFNPNGTSLVASGYQLPGSRYQQYQNSGFGHVKNPYRAFLEVYDLTQIDSSNIVSRSEIFFDGVQCPVIDFSSDGKYLLAAQYRAEEPNLWVWETASRRVVLSRKLTLGRSFMQANFIPNSTQIVYTSATAYHIIDAKAGQAKGTVPRTGYDSTEFIIGDDQTVLFPTASGFRQVHLFSKKVRWDARRPTTPWLMEIHPTQPIMSLIMDNGTVEIWNYKTQTFLFKLYSTKSSEGYVLVNSEGYYFGSKEGVQVLEMQRNGQDYPLEQFDLVLNRPDKLLSILPNINAEQLDYYRVLVAKRTNLTENTNHRQLLDGRLPTITFTNKLKTYAADRLEAAEGQINLTLSVADSSYALRQLEIWVNNVPLFGRKGKVLDGQITYEMAIPIQISTGKNEISAKVTNEKGISSLIEKTTIPYSKPNVKQQIHFIGIGISKYQNAGKIPDFNNLRYAHQDIADMANFLQQHRTENHLITTTMLLDEQATQSAILNLSEKLSTVAVDDIVLLYLAGHGRINGANNWCFTPHDYVELAGQETGITDSLLQDLMYSSPSRKKIIMIDACSSGEQLSDTSNEKSKDYNGVSTASKKGRGVVRAGSSQKKKISIEALKAIFNDFRTESGTVIMAASGAEELAIEEPGIKNGVFTYCLMKAFGTIVADTNFDRQLTLSELMTYTFDEVTRLTENKQQPNFKRRHTGLDFVLWERKRVKVDYGTLFEEN